jgi:hypothetical protein
VKIRLFLPLLLIAVLALNPVFFSQPGLAGPALQEEATPEAPPPQGEPGDLPAEGQPEDAPENSLPEGVSEEWWAQAQQYIELSEYELSWVEQSGLQGMEAAYQAPNRAHDMRTYFSPDGIRIVSRTEITPTWGVGIELRAWGLGDELLPVQPAELLVAAERIDCVRGEMLEWYRNSPDGLEQGFRLPAGAAEVELELSLWGELSPLLLEDGSGLELLTPDGAAQLRWGQLVAMDELGQAWPVGLELREGGASGVYILRLLLPAAGGSLELTARLVSPQALLSPEGLPPAADWTYEGASFMDYLGYSVASAGDVNGDGYGDLIAGAWGIDSGTYNWGKVFVWYGSVDGLGLSQRAPDWEQLGEAAYDCFGISVSSAGDVNGDGYDDIIVSAQRSTELNVKGYAKIFLGSPTGLQKPAAWKVEAAQGNWGFAQRVASAGDLDGDGYGDIVIGAPYYDDGENNEGAVFVWYGKNLRTCTPGTPCSVTSASHDWRYESGLAGDLLGHSVASAGDVNGDGIGDLIAGAVNYDTYRGRVFVWYGQPGVGLGASLRPADWIRSGEAQHHRFGSSVSTAGDVNGDGYDDILIGSTSYTLTWEGVVYLFYGGVVPFEEDPWRYSSRQAETQLGFSVSTAGDVNGDGFADILAGAPYYDEIGQVDSGALYFWYGSAGGMGANQRPPDWKVTTGHVDDRLGFSAAFAGDLNGDGLSDIVAGAPGWDNSTAYDRGKVYVFYGSPGGALTYHGMGNPDPQANAQFGYTVASAGDVNGDGYSDVIIAAPFFDQDGADRGKVYLWHGSAQGTGLFQRAPDWTAIGEGAGHRFGFSVASAGDVNGDGYGEVIIGAQYYNNGQTYEGAAYLWSGSNAGLLPDYVWRVESNKYGTDLGYVVAGAGDLDGDGYGDLVVGAQGYDNVQENEGAVFVWYGINLLDCFATRCQAYMDLPGSGSNWKYESNQAGAQLGWSAASAGDVNGDGYSDLIAGANLWDGAAADQGRVYVWFGSASGLGPDPNWSAVGEGGSDPTGHRFGWSVGTAGDVNGDGFDDIIIGSLGYSESVKAWEGAVYVFYGSAGGIQADFWKYRSDRTETRLGISVSSAGDVNGDGYADILAGALGYDSGHTDEGAALLWYGSAEGLKNNLDGTNGKEPDWRIESDQANAQLGHVVASAGDVNGDGLSDILLGAYLYDFPSRADAGTVYLYHGAETGLRAEARDLLAGDQAQARLGAAAASAGDINGDGYSDLIVGAPGYGGGLGRVYVYPGSPHGFDLSGAWYATGDQVNSGFGASVNSAGDLNGDGYADIVIGAYGYKSGGLSVGAAFVWFGSRTGLGSAGSPATAPWKAYGDQANGFFGRSVGTAGDVNGDGFNDLLVSADGYDNGQTDEGRVYLYYGSPAGLPGSPSWTAESNQAGAFFGYSAASAGDVNGDGFSDLLVGASKLTSGQQNEGAIYAFYGSASGLSAAPDWFVESNQIGAQLGFSVGTAGDVNGDGYSDVIVSATYYKGGSTWRNIDEGGVFVWYGSPAGLRAGDGDLSSADWSAVGGQPGAQFGYSAGTAGDINGDGYSEVIVGARGYNNGPDYEGKIFIYHGSRSGLSDSARWTAEGDQKEANFGHAAAAAGDVNGDGIGDVIVGAPNFDKNASAVNTGQIRVFYGLGKSILTVRPRQMRALYTNPLDARPISPQGLSDSEYEIELRLTGVMPLTRQKFKLEWQLAEFGQPFTSEGVKSGASQTWADSGTEIKVRVGGLAAGKTYHWRVRLIYRSNLLGLAASRWYSLGAFGPQELHFRTPSIPIEGRRLYLPVLLREYKD